MPEDTGSLQVSAETTTVELVSSTATSTQEPPSTSTQGATSSSAGTSSSAESVDVKDVCNKGAGYCYDMKVIQDDYLDNKAPVNSSTALQISAADSSATQSSPAFGHRLRLGSSSFVKTSEDIVIPADSNFGIDIWFTPDFSKSESMIVARLGDLMSIEIYKSDKTAKCYLNAMDANFSVELIESVQSTYFGSLDWHVVSCRLKLKTLSIWHLDAPVGTATADLRIPVEHKVRISIGEFATKNLNGVELGGFVGDLHLVRFWQDVSNYDDVLRQELRSLGLEPKN